MIWRCALWGALAGTGIASALAACLVQVVVSPRAPGPAVAGDAEPRLDGTGGTAATTPAEPFGGSSPTCASRSVRLRREAPAKPEGGASDEGDSRPPAEPQPVPGTGTTERARAGADLGASAPATDSEPGRPRGGGGFPGAPAPPLPDRPTAATEEADPSETPAPMDADLRLLAQLEVDLNRPEAEMYRLAGEYRSMLLARGVGAAVDSSRMALLDRGMAALLRVRPASTVSVQSLLTAERERPPHRYFAMLLRGGDRQRYEPGLVETAVTDADGLRRAGAVLAAGPVPGVRTTPSVLAALADAEAEVRLAAATVAAEASRTSPAWRVRPEVDGAIHQALVRERDPAIRTTLLQALVGTERTASPQDRAFLADLAEVDADPGFRTAWAEAIGLR